MVVLRRRRDEDRLDAGCGKRDGADEARRSTADNRHLGGRAFPLGVHERTRRLPGETIVKAAVNKVLRKRDREPMWTWEDIGRQILTLLQNMGYTFSHVLPEEATGRLGKTV